MQETDFNGRVKVLIFAPSFTPAVKAGGPARSLTNLALATADFAQVTVVTRDRDVGDDSPFPGLSGRTVSRSNLEIYYMNDGSVLHWVSLVRRLRLEVYDVILLNSTWNVRQSVMPSILGMLGQLRGPILLMPRGELEPGALKFKSFKKRMASPVFRSIYRRSVAAFGATSEAEQQNVVKWLPGASTITTKNNLPDHIPYGTPAESSSALRLLYLSRINRKKRLDSLLRALVYVQRPLRLTIAGPAEDETLWIECQAIVQELPPNVEVSYLGTVSREELPRLLWNSDCMALLTAGENYGHVYAEALQAGCPVITTPTTPWTYAVLGGGGTIIDDPDDARSVARVLDSWAAKPRDDLIEARVKAREAFEVFQATAGPSIVEAFLSRHRSTPA